MACGDQYNYSYPWRCLAGYAAKVKVSILLYVFAHTWNSATVSLKVVVNFIISSVRTCM